MDIQAWKSSTGGLFGRNRLLHNLDLGGNFGAAGPSHLKELQLGGARTASWELATKYWWPNLEMKLGPLSSSGQIWSTGGGSLQLEQLATKHWWPSWENCV